MPLSENQKSNVLSGELNEETLEQMAEKYEPPTEEERQKVINILEQDDDDEEDE